MSPEEMIEDYLSRSGDKELCEGIVEYRDNGFLIWNVYKDKFVILQCYGDGEYWDKWANDKAKSLGLKTLYFGTHRNPKSFERKFGYKLTGYILEKEVK